MNAAIDVNSRQTATARLKTANTTIVRLTCNPTTGALDTTTVTLGAQTPLSWEATDENGRTTLMAVSENDSNQLVALQCDASGYLLIKII